MRVLLRQHQIQDPFECPFCQVEIETNQHLLLSCNYTWAVWFGSMLSIKSYQIQPLEINEWIKGCILQGKSHH